jgi:hypothetical protein
MRAATSETDRKIESTRLETKIKIRSRALRGLRRAGVNFSVQQYMKRALRNMGYVNNTEGRSMTRKQWMPSRMEGYRDEGE